MKSLSKVLVGSSLVLSATLFSIGCGGGDACCIGEAPAVDNPPSSIIANLAANQTNTFPATQNALVLNGSVSRDDKGIRTYAWVEVTCAEEFEDGTVVSTDSTYTVTNLPIKPEAKKVCLRVTDAKGQTSTTCHCVNKEAPVATVPCNAPTASLNVTDIGGNLLTTALERSVDGEDLKQYNLNCAGSDSNCAVDTENNLTCEWSANSYLVEGTECDVSEAKKIPYISDCFSSEPEGRAENDYGLKTTTPKNHTFFKICSSGPDIFKCIEINLTVKDNITGKDLSTSTSKIFSVN